MRALREVRAPALSPSRSPVARYLDALYERFRTLDDGDVATSIPELGKADPSWFGLCIATVDGYVYEVGDSQIPFTIQSISKPFVYGFALQDRGTRPGWKHRRCRTPFSRLRSGDRLRVSDVGGGNTGQETSRYSDAIHGFPRKRDAIDGAESKFSQ